MSIDANKLFINGGYVDFTPYIYINGAWKEVETCMYINGEWHTSKKYETLTEFKPASANIAVSSEYSSTYSKAKLVDGSTVGKTGAWATKAGVSYAWIIVDFTTPVKDLTCYLWNRQKIEGDYPLVNGPTTGRIEGSNDNSTWTTLCTISGRGGNTGSSGAKTTHDCTAATSSNSYRYIRLYFTSWAGKDYDYDTYCALGEIAFTCKRVTS